MVPFGALIDLLKALAGLQHVLVGRLEGGVWVLLDGPLVIVNHRGVGARREGGPLASAVTGPRIPVNGPEHIIP